MLPVVVIALVLLAALAWAYNALARMRNIVRNAWSDIDVQLTRRAELVPNLVETVRGYAGFERELLEGVSRARAGIDPTREPSDRAAAEAALSRRLDRLLMVAEAYPELKAGTQFLRLQDELSHTETQIASARRYYNAAVRDYNTLLESFPLGPLGRAFGFRRAGFFAVEREEERDAPEARIEP